MDIRYPDGETSLLKIQLDLEKLPADRVMEISKPNAMPVHPNSLDLMLVIDTTGSMSDELNYLTAEFRNIVKAVRAKYANISMRFGLVVYRDMGDEYVVRSFDFTDSADEMQQRLAAQRANGGGDTPEAVDQALNAALQAHWRGGNTPHLLVWVADAPSHVEKHAIVMQQAKTARRMNIRIYPLAASGVADDAEYEMRMAALLTQGRYLFLTDDSGVGNSHAEPKISCYVVTHLTDLIVRVVDSELSGGRVEPSANQVIRQVGSYDRGECLPKE